ncbi:hypothetical protein [Chryseobacterium sp.]|uniref:hypothetical protein n=1 Tax=Chryseobacterium sp. TaxID=1871047 RepID=UPI00289941C9|nr:hypothetical protein [Chryseobacterium sp.]
MSKNKNQKLANQIFEAHPEQNKVFISENGQAFFDENAVKQYHSKMGFEEDPEVFFREGVEDEDDSSFLEAYSKSEAAKNLLEARLDTIYQITDLEQDYEPVNADTDEIVTAVVSLREKYQYSQDLLLQSNAEVERLSNIQEEKETLSKELDSALKQIASLSKTTPKKQTTDVKSETESNQA